MRKAGANLQLIANELGISIVSVHKHLVKAIDQLHAKSAIDIEQYRKLSLERLDDMTLGIWDKARTGKYQAIDRMIKIEKRRADLLGLDAPKKSDITSDGKPLLPEGAIIITTDQIEKLSTDALEQVRSILANEASDDDIGQSSGGKKG